MNFNFFMQDVNEIAVDTGSVANTVSEVATKESISLLELAAKGGPFIMIPLLILALIAVYIFFDRYVAIKKASKEDTNFMNNIKDNIYEGRVDAAKALCSSNDTPIAKMIEKGIIRIGKPLQDINTAVENVGKIEIAKLEKNISFLATISGAAPMIGFLGTVLGMIKAFYDMAAAGANLDVQLLTTGIYQALVTTVAGLVVGIIAYIGYNILVAKVNKVVNQMEFRTMEFMDILQEPA